jgi:hypothetical protein
MMRKAVTNGNLPGKEGSGRRYWMHANPVGPKSVPYEGIGRRPPKARFLEPYRLSEEHRAALIQLLFAGAVGDAESRELFASAIEYDIANARQALAREEPPATEGPAAPQPVVEQFSEPMAALAPETLEQPGDAKPSLPADLAYASRSLAERIAGLEAPIRDAIAESLRTQDPFCRTYDGAYLAALCAELSRLADAVEGQTQHQAPVTAEAPPADAAPPEPAPPDPPMPEAARRFLRRVVRVYEEVLECPAETEPDGTFVAVLGLVSQEAGVALPRDTARLVEALQGD